MVGGIEVGDVEGKVLLAEVVGGTELHQEAMTPYLGRSSRKVTR